MNLKVDYEDPQVWFDLINNGKSLDNKPHELSINVLIGHHSLFKEQTQTIAEETRKKAVNDIGVMLNELKDALKYGLSQDIYKKIDEVVGSCLTETPEIEEIRIEPDKNPLLSYRVSTGNLHGTKTFDVLDRRCKRIAKLEAMIDQDELQQYLKDLNTSEAETNARCEEFVKYAIEHSRLVATLPKFVTSRDLVAYHSYLTKMLEERESTQFDGLRDEVLSNVRNELSRKFEGPILEHFLDIAYTFSKYKQKE